MNPEHARTRAHTHAEQHSRSDLQEWFESGPVPRCRRRWLCCGCQQGMAHRSCCCCCAVACGRTCTLQLGLSTLFFSTYCSLDSTAAVSVTCVRSSAVCADRCRCRCGRCGRGSAAAAAALLWALPRQVCQSISLWWLPIGLLSVAGYRSASRDRMRLASAHPSAATWKNTFGYRIRHTVRIQIASGSCALTVCTLEEHLSKGAHLGAAPVPLSQCTVMAPARQRRAGRANQS